MEELGIDMAEIRRRMAFLSLLDRDVGLLREMEDLVLREVDRIVDAISQHLLASEETRTFLRDPQTVERLREVQKRYLLEPFRGNFDEVYFERRLEIGAVHYRIGLPPTVYLETYCLYENLRDKFLSPLIAEAYRHEPDGGLARLMAVRKVFCFDMALALEYYFHCIVAELEKRIRELDEFTHTVSHDLKEPLRGIEAFSTFLLEDYATRLDEQGRRYLNFLKSSSTHLKDLINDLLTLTSFSRKGPSLQEVDLNQILTHVEQDLEFSIREKGVEVRILSSLPTLFCDPIQIGEVLRNLLSNAIKFNISTPPWVEIGVREEGPFYLFWVKDNGIGIDPRYTEQIFRPFKRLHSREEYEGTGVGLAICEKAIEGLGGRIWVESEPGGGSTFFFTLPKTQHRRPYGAQ